MPLSHPVWRQTLEYYEREIKMPQIIKALDDSFDDDGAWNVETSQDISINLFGNALQVWAIAQGRSSVAIEEAALAFNVTPRIIEQAVEGHFYMFISNGFIEHDGA